MNAAVVRCLQRLGMVAVASLLPAVPAAGAELFAIISPTSAGPTVARYSDAGQYLGTVPAAYGESLDGLDATPEGRLYFVTNTLGRGGLIALDPPYRLDTTTFLPVPGLEIPIDVAVDANRRAYVTSNRFTDAGQVGVFRYDPASNSTTFIPARRAGGWVEEVAVAPNGDVFVTRESGQVERYDGNTGSFLSAFTPEPATTPFFDIEIGPDGSLYTPRAGGVQRYRADTGAFIDTFIPAGAGGASNIVDLEFAPDGLLYVNSRGSSSVLRFDATTGALRDVFIAPDQYTTGNLGGLQSMTVTIPEPPAGAVVVSCLLLVFTPRVRRRAAATRRSGR
jgi:streptogramin lyase